MNTKGKGAVYLKANCTEGPLPAGKLTLPADEKACDGTVECWTNPRTHMFGQDTCCCKTEEQKASDPSYKCQTSDGPKHNSAACTVHSDTNCTLDDDQWHMLTLTMNKAGLDIQTARRNFKRPKNREDSSDLDENLTDRIAAMKSIISQIFGAAGASTDPSTTLSRSFREIFRRKRPKKILEMIVFIAAIVSVKFSSKSELSS